VLLSVGHDANDHNLLLKGRPFIMRLQQFRADTIAKEKKSRPENLRV
jgi:hypothetical protein